MRGTANDVEHSSKKERKPPGKTVVIWSLKSEDSPLFLSYKTGSAGEIEKLNRGARYNNVFDYIDEALGEPIGPPCLPSFVRNSELCRF